MVVNKKKQKEFLKSLDRKKKQEKQLEKESKKLNNQQKKQNERKKKQSGGGKKKGSGNNGAKSNNSQKGNADKLGVGFRNQKSDVEKFGMGFGKTAKSTQSKLNREQKKPSYTKQSNADKSGVGFHKPKSGSSEPVNLNLFTDKVISDKSIKRTQAQTDLTLKNGFASPKSEHLRKDADESINPSKTSKAKKKLAASVFDDEYKRIRTAHPDMAETEILDFLASRDDYGQAFVDEVKAQRQEYQKNLAEKKGTEAARRQAVSDVFGKEQRNYGKNIFEISPLDNRKAAGPYDLGEQEFAARRQADEAINRYRQKGDSGLTEAELFSRRAKEKGLTEIGLAFQNLAFQTGDNKEKAKETAQRVWSEFKAAGGGNVLQAIKYMDDNLLGVKASVLLDELKKIADAERRQYVQQNLEAAQKQTRQNILSGANIDPRQTYESEAFQKAADVNRAYNWMDATTATNNKLQNAGRAVGQGYLSAYAGAARLFGGERAANAVRRTDEMAIANKASAETKAGKMSVDILSQVGLQAANLPFMVLGGGVGQIAEGLGYMKAAKALQIGVTGLGYGTSSAGQELQHAYDAGATKKQARTSAAVSGALEVLFGGMSEARFVKAFNGDINAGGKYITNALKRVLSETLISGSMEGVTEYLTSVGQQTAARVIYNNPEGKSFLEILGEEAVNKDNLYAGALGAVMGGGMGAVGGVGGYQAAKQTRAIRDYAQENGMSEAEVRARLADGTLPALVYFQSQTAQFINDTVDTITETKENADSKADGKADIDGDIRNFDNAENAKENAGDSRAYNPIRYKMADKIKAVSGVDLNGSSMVLTAGNIKTMMDNGVQVENIKKIHAITMAPDSIVRGSENGKSVVFVKKTGDKVYFVEMAIADAETGFGSLQPVDIKGFDTAEAEAHIDGMDLPLAQKETIRQDMQGVGNLGDGFVQGQTEQNFGENSEKKGVVKTEELTAEQMKVYRQMSSFAEARGGRIVVRDDMEPGNPGCIIKNDDGTFEIVVSNEALADYVVMGHELTHALEGTEEYGEYAKFIESELESRGVSIAAVKADITRVYAEHGKILDDLGAEKELIAMYTAKHLFDDQVVINRLAVEKPNLFQRIWEWIQDKIASLRGRDSAFYVDTRKRFVAAYRSAGGAYEGRWGEDTGRQDWLSPKFEQEYNNWIKNGRKDRGLLFVGRTSKALRSIGVKNQRIVWDTGKINKTLAKHKNLNDEILKQVPNIIENPVLIMESISRENKGNNRVVMYGEVYDINNLPVLAVLELEPNNKQGVVINEIKIASTYSKDSNAQATQKLIDNSKILYIDPNKKRTENWLSLNRLQLPLGVSQFGSIGRVAYSSDVVKRNAKENSGNFNNALGEQLLAKGFASDNSIRKNGGSDTQNSIAFDIDEIISENQKGDGKAWSETVKEFDKVKKKVKRDGRQDWQLTKYQKHMINSVVTANFKAAEYIDDIFKSKPTLRALEERVGRKFADKSELAHYIKEQKSKNKQQENAVNEQQQNNTQNPQSKLTEYEKYLVDSFVGRGFLSQEDMQAVLKNQRVLNEIERRTGFRPQNEVDIWDYLDGRIMENISDMQDKQTEQTDHQQGEENGNKQTNEKTAEKSEIAAKEKPAKQVQKSEETAAKKQVEKTQPEIKIEEQAETQQGKENAVEKHQEKENLLERPQEFEKAEADLKKFYDKKIYTVADLLKAKTEMGDIIADAIFSDIINNKKGLDAASRRYYFDLIMEEREKKFGKIKDEYREKLYRNYEHFLDCLEVVAGVDVKEKTAAEKQLEKAMPEIKIEEQAETQVKKTNSNEVIKKLSNNIKNLQDMKSVINLTGKEFPKSDRKITEQVAEFFAKFGNKVLRKDFGYVIIDHNSVKDDIAHGLGRAKSVTFAAVPDVIKYGRQIDFQENWKGRGYDSYVFAAPVNIGGKTAYMAVVVTKKIDGRFYLHEVVDENGNIIFIKKEPADIKTPLVAEDGSTRLSTDSKNSIPQNNSNSNAESGIEQGKAGEKSEKVIEVSNEDNLFEDLKNSNEPDYIVTARYNARLAEEHYREKVAPLKKQFDDLGLTLDEKEKVNLYFKDVDQWHDMLLNAEKLNEVLHVGGKELRVELIKKAIQLKVDIRAAMKQIEKINLHVAYKTDAASYMGEIFGGRHFGLEAVNSFRSIYDNFRIALQDASANCKAYFDKEIFEPLAAAKKGYADGFINQAKDLEKNVIDLGIKAGSKESAAVQWLGEKKKPVYAGQTFHTVDYTLLDLQEEFNYKMKNGKYAWENIVAAERYIRTQYDMYVDKINDVLEVIYPNPYDEFGELIPGQRLLKRKDYFHHFNDFGFDDVHNVLLNTSTEIDPHLIGISEDMKPKTKWTGFLQHRSENAAYKADAVHGFLTYMQLAEYKINIEPLIPEFRALYRAMQDGADMRGVKDSKNSLIAVFDGFINELAGKTNFIDRLVAGSGKPSGRAFLNMLDKMQGKAKAAAILGNFGSMFVQVSNCVNFLPFIKKKYLTAGHIDYLKYKAGNAEMLEAVRQSQFLQERYMSRAVRGFEKGMMHKVEDMAAYGLELGDKIVNEVGWFAAYRQGKEMADVTDPVRYADDMVRSCVGGRGIGEMPAVVKSRLVNSLIPFQVEILNTYNIYKRVLQENGKFKSFGKLAELMIGNSIFNAVMTMTIGRSILFDPIAVIAKCLMDDGDDDDTEVDGYLDKTVDCMLRLTGNFLSTAPFAAFVMGVFCDQEDIKQLFGEENPNRYGTGLLGVGKIFHEGVNLTLGNDVDWKGAATAFVKYGKQIDRILEFMEDYSYLPDIEFNRKGGFRLNGHSLDGKFRFGADQTGRFGKDGSLQYALEKKPADMLKDLLFGGSATKGGRRWVEGGFKSGLSVEATKAWMAFVEDGLKPQTAKDSIDLICAMPNYVAKEYALSVMDISAEAKGIAYYNVVTNDEGRQMIDTLLKYGSDYGKAYDFCHTLDICKAVGIEYPNKAVFLDQTGLSEEKQAEVFYNLFATKYEKEKLEKMLDYGFDKTEYFKICKEGYNVGFYSKEARDKFEDGFQSALDKGIDKSYILQIIAAKNTFNTDMCDKINKGSYPQDRVWAMLQQMPLSSSQKDTVHCLFWSSKSLKYAPWHGGKTKWSGDPALRNEEKSAEMPQGDPYSEQSFYEMFDSVFKKTPKQGFVKNGPVSPLKEFEKDYLRGVGKLSREQQQNKNLYEGLFDLLGRPPKKEKNVLYEGLFELLGRR